MILAVLQRCLRAAQARTHPRLGGARVIIQSLTAADVIMRYREQSQQDILTMSEYQYYEFAAIDKPLTCTEMAELRAVSTRAIISPSGFTNHYEWGDLKADPADWMRRYFDAFVYLGRISGN